MTHQLIHAALLTGPPGFGLVTATDPDSAKPICRYKSGYFPMQKWRPRL